MNRGVWYTDGLFNWTSSKHNYFYRTKHSYKCFSGQRQTIIAILFCVLYFVLAWSPMPEITYIDDENILQIVRIKRRGCGIYCPRNEHPVSFVPGNLRTYFSAISLITSRHGSFICIIRTNIQYGFARSTNEKAWTYTLVHISHVVSHFRYRVISTKEIDLHIFLWLDVRR